METICHEAYWSVMPNGKLKRLFDLQAGVCPYCTEKMTLEKNKPNSATTEHIIPRSKGGKEVVAACYSCNQEKSNIPLIIFLAYR